MTRVRVLVADDNEGIRDLLTSMLAAEFDVIQAVSDGGSALAAATELLPDVAILDISMPVLNGIEVARLIKDAAVKTAVVFLTTSSDLDTFRAARETGSLGYVLKPRMGTDLVPAINLALNGDGFVSPGIG